MAVGSSRLGRYLVTVGRHGDGWGSSQALIKGLVERAREEGAERERRLWEGNGEPTR
jgi:hypothetical protein